MRPSQKILSNIIYSLTTCSPYIIFFIKHSTFLSIYFGPFIIYLCGTSNLFPYLFSLLPRTRHSTVSSPNNAGPQYFERPLGICPTTSLSKPFKTFTANLSWRFLDYVVVANFSASIGIQIFYIYMMPSNVTSKFRKIWSTNFCPSHIQIKFTITVLKYSKLKMQNKLFKIRTLNGYLNIQIWIQFSEQKKTKINGKVIHNVKIELRTLKSYTKNVSWLI